MTEPTWLAKSALLKLHAVSLARYGGPPGLRDEGLLESALARPLNLHAYSGENDRARLAAAYAYGLAKNHPFVDGNKRAALAAALTFLDRNGYGVQASSIELAEAVLTLAASSGEAGELAFADWLRPRLARY
ncbi:MAG: type II toxin-antitoxin system death-on-curing family toxin [Tagaea sp.]